MQYEKEGTMFRPLLNAALDKYAYLDGRDRAFIKSLSEGVVERIITLDYIADRVSKTPAAKMKPVIRMIIRMGIYQLVFMEHVPDSAAVNEAVKLTRLKHIEGLKGVVNGVLRTVARLRDEGIKYPDIETEYSCPKWIADKLRADHGKEKAEDVIRAGVGSVPLYLRANGQLTDAGKVAEELLSEGVKAVKCDDTPYVLKVDEGSLIPGQSESFINGHYSVQDLSSQIAIYELWKQIVVYISDGKQVDINVIDMCAAPGGKSCALAEILGEKGRVRSYDISEEKLSKIRQNADRTKLSNIEITAGDATVYNGELAGAADAVIADLPCSGLGDMGRKVDIKYRVKPDDVVALCELQRRILDNAVRYLKPEGILLFSVCTVTKEETSNQSDYLASKGLHKVGERLFLQGADLCDGFYFSIWRRG
jgi:16S rRNA (cytosine967-C5)-methyltransferase